MTAKAKLTRILFIASIVSALAIVAAAGGLYFLRGAQRSRAAANLPPTVLVNAPADGDSAPAGGFLPVQITAAAQNPIARLEMWLDGVLLETQTPDLSLGEVTTFYAVSELEISEGPHLFSARVIDANGLVGQSPPIAIEGQARQAEVAAAPSGGEGQDGGNNDQQPGGNLPAANNGQPGGGQPPASSGQPGGGGASGFGPSIIPPAPLPVTPPNLPALQVGSATLVDFRSLIPILLSAAPKAPSALQAGYENCTVRLTWMDNADNETGFNVWMQALGGPPKVIATLKGSPQTGPAWYEFAAPTTGIYSFWVEARNALGAQSSEIAWVGVTDLTCSPGVATQLNIDIVDMFVSGGYDRAYCYLSVEGAPEKRVPVNDGQFVQVLGGWGDVSKWTGSGSSFLLPEPQDGEVTLEGKCLGWRGGSGPDDLGSFKASVPKSQWDGRRLELKGAGFTIGYRIQPHGAAQASGFFTYTDYTIPSPSQPWITTDTSSNAVENEKLARRPTLHWKWTGDASKLTGFTIFLDGKFFRSVPNWQGGPPGKWEQMFLLPSSCSGTYRFQVAANYGEAQSAPSAVYEHKQPQCKIFAEIKFETITFTDIDDHEPGSCDTAEVYGDILLNPGTSLTFGNDENTAKMGCGTYFFSQLPGGNAQPGHTEDRVTSIAPIDPANPNIDIWGLLWDEDDIFGGVHDHLCGFGTVIRMPYQNWANYSKKYTLRCGEGVTTSQRGGFDAEGFVEFTVKGFNAPPGGP